MWQSETTELRRAQFGGGAMVVRVTATVAAGAVETVMMIMVDDGRRDGQWWMRSSRTGCADGRENADALLLRGSCRCVGWGRGGVVGRGAGVFVLTDSLVTNVASGSADGGGTFRTYVYSCGGVVPLQESSATVPRLVYAGNAGTVTRGTVKCI